MARQFRRRKFCRFTADEVTEIDYKDINVLKQVVTVRMNPTGERVAYLLQVPREIYVDDDGPADFNTGSGRQIGATDAPQRIGNAHTAFTIDNRLGQRQLASGFTKHQVCL